jgi:S-DNA-T family DNA segregation ATPase FtsK/SpoIIIE
MRRNPSKLAFALGRDISGHPRVADLAKMPHLLIAGATNSGKSVCLNAMIASILFRATPDEVRFLMVDPKRVELSLFDKIPHLVYPVAYNVKEVKGLLLWAIKEMERRYEMFAATGVRNIYGYKEQRTIDGEMENLPFIVIVIDELADLMMQAASEFETAICRIAQLARATGIHLVVATQRPSVNVITGTIKANIASRVAFAVASQVDSRTILDMNGAERLVGSGDMLYLPIDASKPTRIQGAYISEADTGRLADYLREQGEPQYCAEPVEVEGKTNGGGSDESVDDDLFAKALEYVLATKYASASMLQRKLRVGYTRAARLIDMMEERGYIGPHEGSKARQVYAQPIRGIDDDDAPPLRTARVMGAEADADDEEPPALSVDEVEEETDDR